MTLISEAEFWSQFDSAFLNKKISPKLPLAPPHPFLPRLYFCALELLLAIVKKSDFDSLSSPGR